MHRSTRTFDLALHYNDLRALELREVARLAFMRADPFSRHALVFVYGVPDHKVLDLLDKVENLSCTGTQGAYTFQVFWTASDFVEAWYS